MIDALTNLLLISIGGALGASTRYWVTSKAKYIKFLPLGTLIVNTVGSFLLGFFLTLSTYYIVETGYILLIGTGFLGSFTTMSTFVIETLSFKDVAPRLAFTNFILMILFVLLGVILGNTLGVVMAH